MRRDCAAQLIRCGMVTTNASIAWRLFHLNWIPIAAMGGVLLFGVILCGFSFEPVAAIAGRGT